MRDQFFYLSAKCYKMSENAGFLLLIKGLTVRWKSTFGELEIQVRGRVDSNPLLQAISFSISLFVPVFNRK